MRKISVYITSFLLLLSGTGIQAQDTVMFPLKIRIGADISGPGIYLADRNNLRLEGFVSFDRNEKMSYVAEAGYLNFKYSQYNYSYASNGYFARVGVDFNILHPTLSQGKYQAGIGLRYGFSIYDSETPLFSHENYWGTTESSIPLKTRMGHFIEVTPGVKAEILKNISMGWNIRLKLLVSGGGGKDLRPISFPGYGSSGKQTAAGISYYITWNIPYRIKRVIIQPEIPEETEPEDETQGTGTHQQSAF